LGDVEACTSQFGIGEARVARAIPERVVFWQFVSTAEDGMVERSCDAPGVSCGGTGARVV
jgi:hypothetical protein